MSPAHPASTLAIVGLGNPLCRDDGAGVVAVGQLNRAYQAPPGVRVLDGGTAGLSLLPFLLEADQLILLDALVADAPPGTLVRLRGDELLDQTSLCLSAHQVGVKDLLAVLRLCRESHAEPPLLLGVVAASVEPGLDLSPAVEASLPALISLTVEEARRRGFDFDLAA